MNITPDIDNKLQDLRDAAFSGQLGTDVSQFVLRTVAGVYSAPGNFLSEKDMRRHLDTLNYLINLHVYRS